MKISAQTVVTLAYDLSVYGQDESLQLLESKTKQNPIEFIYATGVLLPKVEEVILGQTMGFKKSVVLFPQDAFGEFKPELEQWQELSKFPKNINLRVGMKFQTQGPGEEVIAVMVKEVKEDKVLLDGNHPLAGLKLQFDLEVLRVRAASEEELLTGEVRKLFH